MKAPNQHGKESPNKTKTKTKTKKKKNGKERSLFLIFVFGMALSGFPNCQSAIMIYAYSMALSDNY